MPGMSNSKSKKEDLILKTMMNPQAPLPKNFKRIPAMIENLTRKEELKNKKTILFLPKKMIKQFLYLKRGLKNLQTMMN